MASKQAGQWKAGVAAGNGNVYPEFKGVDAEKFIDDGNKKLCLMQAEVDALLPSQKNNEFTRPNTDGNPNYAATIQR